MGAHCFCNGVRRCQFAVASVLHPTSLAVAAIPVACLASYFTDIDSTSLTQAETIFIACIMRVGGSGNIAGLMPGVMFMIILPELLVRELYTGLSGEMSI
jgi:ABC-type branched-subunit amino acid transport system permease subunit